MPEHELAPAIKALERRVDEAEQKASNLLSALNILREDAGLPPRPPGRGISTATNGAAAAEDPALPSQIQSDTFFNKPQQTAVREYLEMRRAQNQGPAKPREIYEALVAGGYQYQAKDAETALVGLRAMLRKRTNVFVKVGDTGAYGLVSWYGQPNRARPSAPGSTKTEGTDTPSASPPPEPLDEESATNSDESEAADYPNGSSAA